MQHHKRKDPKTSSTRVEALEDFARTALEIGRKSFRGLLKEDPSLGWEVYDFFRLPKTSLHEDFYREIINPTREEKLLAQDQAKKDTLEKNYRELGQKMDIYGEPYKIVNSYYRVDTDRETPRSTKYEVLVVGFPYWNKDKRKEDLFITETVDEGLHPGTYTRVKANYGKRVPMRP